MSLKTICESMILYDDDNLSTILDSVISEVELWFMNIVDENDYKLYNNTGENYGITSIAFDPDNDNSDIIEIRLSNEYIHGFMKATGFLEDYDFLNDKVSKVESGVDSSGETYKYVRYEIDSDFDTEYDSTTHAGSFNSLWFALMQRAICSIVISRFVFSARRISSDSSIFINTSWGEGESVPEGTEGLSSFAGKYRAYGKELISSYYINKKYDNESRSELYTNSMSNAKSDFSYQSFEV
jgi:hypothetical protein